MTSHCGRRIRVILVPRRIIRMKMRIGSSRIGLGSRFRRGGRWVWVGVGGINCPVRISISIRRRGSWRVRLFLEMGWGGSLIISFLSLIIKTNTPHCIIKGPTSSPNPPWLPPNPCTSWLKKGTRRRIKNSISNKNQLSLEKMIFVNSLNETTGIIKIMTHQTPPLRDGFILLKNSLTHTVGTSLFTPLHPIFTTVYYSFSILKLIRTHF